LTSLCAARLALDCMALWMHRVPWRAGGSMQLQLGLAVTLGAAMMAAPGVLKSLEPL